MLHPRGSNYPARDFSANTASITPAMANSNPLQYIDDIRYVVPIPLVIVPTVTKITLIPMAASSIQLILAVSSGSASDAIIQFFI